MQGLQSCQDAKFARMPGLQCCQDETVLDLACLPKPFRGPNIDSTMMVTNREWGSHKQTALQRTLFSLCTWRDFGSRALAPWD